MAKMTQKRFYEELAKWRGKFKMSLGGCGLILYSKGCIEYCPITAVNFTVNGKVVDPFDWRCAADDLGLGINFAERVVDAADGVGGCPTHDLIRKKLLSILGLKEL